MTRKSRRAVTSKGKQTQEESEMDIETLTTLNRKRENLRRQLSKIELSLTQDESADINYMQAQLDILLKLQEKFELLKTDFYETVPEEKFDETEITLAALDDEMNRIEVSLKTSINKIKKSSNVSTLSNPNADLTRNSQKNEYNKKAIKLPEIPLPVFSGKFEEWNLFKSQFKALIDDNAELSENEKLFYLRGSLKGDAKTVETPDDNYMSLYKALVNRYENRRIIVDCHIKNLINLPTIKYESAKDLRNLIDNIQKNLRALKVLEFERDKLSNIMLLNIILEKLDRETRKQFELLYRIMKYQISTRSCNS